GGFKSNEDYTYIRGRGRGKYVCGECGIRCKKPSMLKKHIRTHTDLRPYSCRHCSFAFKTKGNLTKHMKSKAHHKKCVELGVPIIPTEKQQQQQQQTNVEPGQFDDANDSTNINEEKNQSISSNMKQRQRKISIIETGHCPIISTPLSTEMVEKNNENPVTTTTTTTIGHNENEAEAIHSLLILSSGATTSNHCHRPLLDGQTQQQQQPQPTLVASIPSTSSSSSMTDINHLSSLYPNQRSIPKFIPEFYGYDTALLKQINSIDSIMMNKSGTTPPPILQQIPPQPNNYRQPMSHPTSVIITNHQSTQQHQQPHPHPTSLNTSPRK
ncbi:hypothetical protein BLA29_005085, partial [Euroglyphus maynei]